MRTVLAIIGIVAGLSGSSGARGEWRQITYAREELRASVNKGQDRDGFSYAALRPGDGAWRQSYDLRSQVSALRVWSARNICFHQWNLSPGDAAQASFITFKICLSQKVTSCTWDLPAHYRNLYGGGTLVARYSTDGVHFTTAYSYPRGTGDIDPPIQTLRFSAPTNVVYVGWSSRGPAFYNPGSLGTLTFTPAAPPVIFTEGHQLLVDGVPLHGLFVTWHYPWRDDEEYFRSEFQRMKAMGVVGVGLEVGWNVCEPADGQFAFDSLVINRIIGWAGAEGLWVHLLLAPHYTPSWVYAKYGDIQMKDAAGSTVQSGFLPFSPSCRPAAADQADFQSAAIRYFERYPNVIAFFLTNEQGYAGPGVWVDYSTWALAAWRDWLRGISPDPTFWQSRWSAPGPVDPAEASLPTTEAEGQKWKDWMRFRSDEFNRYLNQLYDGATTGRTRFIPVGHKGYFFNSWWVTPREWGVRYSPLMTKMDIVGNDDYDSLSTMYASALSFGKPILTAETNISTTSGNPVPVRGTPTGSDGQGIMARRLVDEFFRGGRMPSLYCWNNVEEVPPWGMFSAGSPLTGTLGAQVAAGIFSGITDDVGTLAAQHAILVPADKILTTAQGAGYQFHGGFMYLNDRMAMTGWYSHMIYSDDVKPSCYLGRGGSGLSLAGYRVLSSMTVSEAADRAVLESTEVQNWVNAGGVLFLALWETPPPAWTGVTAVPTTRANYSWYSDAKYFRAVSNARAEGISYALSTAVSGSKTFARWDGTSNAAILAVPHGAGWVVVVGTPIFIHLCQNFTWPILWDVMDLAGYSVPVSPMGPAYRVQGETLLLGMGEAWSGTASLPDGMGQALSITQYDGNGNGMAPTVSCSNGALTGSLGSMEFCVVRLAGTTTLFSDGFESGNFTDGGWSNSGGAISSTYTYAGSRAVEFNSSDSLVKSLSTVGYTDIRVSYARYTRQMESDDHFIVEWSGGDGWTTLEDLTGNSGWMVRTFVLPTAAADNAAFQLRFRTSHNGSTDYAYLDAVKIIGVPMAESPAVRPPVDVYGTVVVEGFVGERAGVGVKFEWTPAGGGTAITRYALLDANGDFRLEGIPPGRYDVAVKAYASLTTQLANVTVDSNPTVLAAPIVLRGDDINGDDLVTFEDFSVLQNTYGQRGAGVSPPGAAAGVEWSGGCGVLGAVLLAGWGVACFGLRRDDGSTKGY